MIELCASVLGHPITVTALTCGRDWSVTILGGCAPHVGSVTLAEYENGAARLRSLLREGHKDQVVGERFARRLSELGQCTVCAACGIHYEGPSKADLEQIVACAAALLDKLCQEIETARRS